MQKILIRIGSRTFLTICTDYFLLDKIIKFAETHNLSFSVQTPPSKKDETLPITSLEEIWAIITEKEQER